MKQAQTEPRNIKSAYVLTANQSGIDLTMIGVPASLQKLRPTEGYFPAGFNQDARPLWQAMFSDPIFMQDTDALTDRKEAWLHAVRTYMDQCDREGKDPFRSRRDPTVNNAARKVLMARRLEVVRFLDRSRLFSAVQLDPITARHGFEITTPGNLRITASVDFTFGDRDSLVQFLKGPMRMFQDGNGGYTRNLLKTVKVNITNIRSKKARLSYSIELAPPFHVPEERKTKNAKHDWFDKEFFNPMVRGYRFTSVLRRIKF